MVRERKKVLLPEMTWPEVEEALKETDIAIIPVGSCEQHGLHLPLGTDFFQALERCKKIAKKAGAVVAPLLWFGHSEHHMGFPGTISLTPETLIQVLFEACRSLSTHGFRKIIIFNNHGGNEVAVKSATQKANMELDATVVTFGVANIAKYKLPGCIENLDIHAGYDETAAMLMMFPDLVELDKAKEPTMTLSTMLSVIKDKMSENPAFYELFFTQLPPTHKISDTGSITLLGNPASARNVISEKRILEGKMLREIINFIKEWRRLPK